MKTKNFIRPLIGTLVILAVPAISMLFNVDGVAWGLFDFIIMGALLYIGGLTYEFFALKVHSTEQRILIGIAVLFVVLVIWSQMAVQAVSQLIQFLL